MFCAYASIRHLNPIEDYLWGFEWIIGSSYNVLSSSMAFSLISLSIISATCDGVILYKLRSYDPFLADAAALAL